MKIIFQDRLNHSDVMLLLCIDMKWTTYLCQVIAFFVTVAQVSNSRTVQPVSYSYTTSNDGVYRETFQDGVHWVNDLPAVVQSEHPITIHPSIMTHHYYQPITENSYELQYYRPINITTSTEALKTPVPSQQRRPRKKYEHVAKVSYVFNPEIVNFTTTINDIRLATKPPLRKVLLQTGIRIFKPKYEIPVEESFTESVTRNQYLNPIQKLGAAQESPLKVYQRVKMNKQIGNIGRLNLKNDTENTGHENTANEKNNRNNYLFKINEENASNIYEETHTTEEIPTTQYSTDQLKRSTERTRYRGKVKSNFTNIPNYFMTNITTAKDITKQKGENSDSVSLLNSTQNPYRINGKKTQPLITRTSDYVEDKFTSKPMFNQQQLIKRSQKKTTPLEIRDFSPHTAESSDVKYQNETTCHTPDLPMSTAKQLSSSNIEQIITNEEDESDPNFENHPESVLREDYELAEKDDYPDEYEDDTEEEEVQSENIEHPMKILQKPLYYAYLPDQKQSASDDHKEPKEVQNDGISTKGEKSKSSHHQSDGEKTKKGYDSQHVYDNMKKGQLKKINRSKLNHEEGGQKKKRKEDSGHYKGHHLEEKGEKKTEFKENGKHKKGHSTKGKPKNFSLSHYIMSCEIKFAFFDATSKIILYTRT